MSIELGQSKKTANQAVEEGKLCEVRMQLESEDKNIESWRQSETEQVKLTISFDIAVCMQTLYQRFYKII